ncbi:ATP-binding protein [Streptomyces sp. DSM 44917]|uniref:ATP-binding protein n=1 Tax=Streptomyces boetiae TaxID=3075541 RepID=A0ABU2LGC5_9ACTN|nr:ATP-binding protein [Streptomyces sp. DSM 44917]MDT0310639.1 ATP-binding protein [Streptomyces sp. DSM 44917]
MADVTGGFLLLPLRGRCGPVLPVGAVGGQEPGERFGEVSAADLAVDDPEAIEDRLIQLPSHLGRGAGIQLVGIGAEQQRLLHHAQQRVTLDLCPLDAVARAVQLPCDAFLFLLEQVEDAELVVSELVSNAVVATGLPDPDVKLHEIQGEHPIAVQLRVVDSRLYIEVWERSTTAPVKKDANDEAGHGRSLLLVEAVTRRWGVARPPAGGKVVWAELVIGTPPIPRDSPSTGPDLQRRVPQATRLPRGEVLEMASVALLERVLEGLGRV